MTCIPRGIYIDDAGTPGAVSKSECLPEDRKSFCAVVVPAEVELALSDAMEVFLAGVRQDFGANELHFTDIYSGRGVWKQASVHQRIEVFDLMASLLEGFKLPVIFQTSSAQFETSVISEMKFKKGVWWNSSDIQHQALLWLCFRTAKEIQSFRKEPECPFEFRQPFPAFIDEGLMKQGAEVDLPNWGDVFQGQKLTFVSSQASPGIQLADFAAFCIARTQWLAARQDAGTSLKRADRHIMQSSGRLNCWNLSHSVIDPLNFPKVKWEKEMKRNLKSKSVTKSDGKRVH